MSEFFESRPGRILVLSVAVALIGGSAAALMGPGDVSNLVFSASLFLPIVMNVVGLPEAIEDHAYHAILAVIALPVLLILWAVGIGVTRAYQQHVGLTYLFLAAGLAALAVAARPALLAPALRTAAPR